MESRQSILKTYGIPVTPGPRPSNGGSSNRRATTSTTASRASKRYSVNALYSMAAEQDVEVEDDLARGRVLSRLERI
jgi:Ras GTPase-activating-like protein IQGAP2/3